MCTDTSNVLIICVVVGQDAELGQINQNREKEQLTTHVAHYDKAKLPLIVEYIINSNQNTIEILEVN